MLRATRLHHLTSWLRTVNSYCYHRATATVDQWAPSPKGRTKRSLGITVGPPGTTTTPRHPPESPVWCVWTPPPFPPHYIFLPPPPPTASPLYHPFTSFSVYLLIALALMLCRGWDSGVVLSIFSNSRPTQKMKRLIKTGNMTHGYSKK